MTGERSGGLARNTLVMASGTILSRVTGFLRLAAASAAFGVAESHLPDAYNTANVVPNIVYELVLGGVLSSVLVPIFVETRQRDEAGEHRHVVNAVTSLALLVLVAVVAASFLLAPLLATALTSGVSGTSAEIAATRRVVTLFLRLFLPQVAFYGLTTIWTAYLNAHRRFAAPMFSPVLNNVVTIAVLLAFGASVGFEPAAIGDLSAGQLWLLGLGTTVGIVAMTLPLWPVARRVGWSWRPTLDWRHPMVRRVGKLGTWAVLYVLVNQLGYLLVVALANAAPGQGGYSAYLYAFTFFQLPHGIYAVSVMTALVPALAEAAARADADAFRRQLGRGVRATVLLIVPAAVGLGVLAVPLVRLLLEHGAFTAASTQLVARVLSVFVLGLASFSVFQLLLRAFYALQDTRTPALLNVAVVAVNVVVDVAAFVLLPGEWKVAGLAFGHAASYTFGALMLATALRRRLGGLEGRRTLVAVARVAAAAAVMGVCTWAAARGVAAAADLTTLAGQGAQVAAGVVAGVTTYVVAARVFRVEELVLVTARLRARLARAS